MNFPSIDIQGSILSAELLGKIRAEQANFQNGKDFNTNFNNSKLKDEISLAWQDAKAQWTIFNNKLKRLGDNETAATETRQFWIIPLLASLGYDFQYIKQAEELNGKSFWINFREQNIGGFPLYIAGYFESLDRKPENKSLRVSPHALVQEYLNYSEHLYGLVTNGKHIRLLRDASRLTRLSYVEFNLEKIMEEDLYSDFVILYRLLHVSRMPQAQDGGENSIIEKYHQEGLEAGATIRNKLGDAVKATIENLANGFINHPNNAELRQLISEGKLNTDEYYKQMLRIIYRMLYLFVVEERNLVYGESKDKDAKRFNQIYFNHYSLLRLRKLAKQLPPPDAHHHYDLWFSLVNTFALFEDTATGKKLGLMALKGDLFGYHAISTSNYDLHNCHLSNNILLQAIKALGYFENEKKVLIAVNYGGLDVEEFGSVYEGLLELKIDIKPVEGNDTYSCTLTGSNERGKSGSHYTPEELVQPLIKHSLQYIIDERKDKPDAEQQLLDIKVCDVACGSGHILLSAARKIALELACIRETKASNSKEKVEQPSPLYLRQAMRDVIRHCIYGVDKNPLAVELCKVALWLEAHNPNEPLNFLDHHIKCGDAIVGLAHREELEKGIADEAFKTLPGDDKEVASAFAKQNKAERKEREAKIIQIKADFEVSTTANVQEAMEEYKNFNKLPETTPDEIEAKQRAYKKFLDGKGFTFLKTMADTQVAQFFIPKIIANKDKLITDNEYRQILAGQKGWQGQKTALATAIAHEKRIFHWFLEFPEVFQKNGFDCILGNPPFLNGTRISSNYGSDYLKWLNYNYLGAANRCDLVAYFFRRNYTLIKKGRFLSMISTNSISQADTREGGLDRILNESGKIIFAIKNKNWPGKAAVVVSLLSIYKGNWDRKAILENKEVSYISSLLDNIEFKKPYQLKIHDGLSYTGTYVLGSGFILNEFEATNLIKLDPKNSTVIKPYSNGDDVNNRPDQSPSRWVIDYGKMNLEDAKKYDEVWQIIENKVKKERNTKSTDVKSYPYWQHWRPRFELYEKIKDFKFVMVSCRVSKYVSQSLLPPDRIFDIATTVLARSTFTEFVFFSSSIHVEWAWKYGSSMKRDIRYTNTDCIDTYPLASHISSVLKQKIEILGETYYEHRKNLMLKMQLGLTKTYNLFHSNAITSENIKNQDKQIVSLKKHLENTPDTISFDEAIKGILKLRELHKQMDEAVLEAYEWGDIQLRHDFYEVDYLPENDRVRFTIHPDARKEVLKRLLELNHQYYEEEIKQGLHKMEDVQKFYEQKGQPIPPEVIAIMGAAKKEKKTKEYKKTKSKKSTANESESVYNQPGLFGEKNLFNQTEE